LKSEKNFLWMDGRTYVQMDTPEFQSIRSLLGDDPKVKKKD